MTGEATGGIGAASAAGDSGGLSGIMGPAKTGVSIGAGIGVSDAAIEAESAINPSAGRSVDDASVTGGLTNTES